MDKRWFRKGVGVGVSGKPVLYTREETYIALVAAGNEQMCLNQRITLGYPSRLSPEAATSAKIWASAPEGLALRVQNQDKY